MADPVSALAAKVAEWVGMTVWQVVSNPALGLSTSTAATIANVAQLTAQAVVTVASYAGLAMLTRPEIPKASAGKFTVQQTMPPRIRVVNTARVGGGLMLKENKRNLYIVKALCQAPVKSVPDFWFHSDKVTRNATTGRVTAPPGANSGRYKGNGSWLFYRLGAIPETSYNDGVVRNGETFDDLGAGVWTTNHRLDGICSVCGIFAPVEKADYAKYLPFGHPEISARPVGKVYDWRKDSTRGGSGPQRLDDWSTWDESANVIVWLATKKCGPPEGDRFQERFIKRILGQVDAWTQAADDCDDAIALAAGGTAPRYRTGGGWHTDEHDDVEVCKRLLAACDGFMLEGGNGSVHVQVGKWREPTFTLPKEHVIRLTRSTGQTVETHKNRYDIRYTDPARDWALVPGDPWEDAADIALHGKKPADFIADWVMDHAQARRLAKISMKRQRPASRGTVTATLYLLNLFWGAPASGVANRRWFNIEREKADGTIETILAEVAGAPRFDIKTMSVTVDWIEASAATYDWNAATEEGAVPAPTAPTPTTEVTPDPVGLSLVVTSTFDHLVP